MKSFFIEEPQNLTKETLFTGWASRTYSIDGDSIIAFIGENQLLPAVPVPEGTLPKPNPRMLHFIIEHYRLSKTEGILRLRLLASLFKDNLGFDGFVRKGTNLYFFNSQISISAIFANPFSTVSHVGFFLDALTSPIDDMGLEELDIPVKDFAIKSMQDYLKEVEDLDDACRSLAGLIL